MGEGVDAERGLLDETDSEDTGVDETAEPVAPTETSDDGRQNEGHENDALEVVAMLPDNDRVLVKVGDIGSAQALGVLFKDHPPDVGVEKTFADGVGVLFGVGVPVMSTVAVRPPADRALNSASTDSSQVELEGSSGLVGGVSPKTMVTYKMVGRSVSTTSGRRGHLIGTHLNNGLTSSYSKAGVKVEDDGPDAGIEVERDPVGRDKADDGNDDDESGVEPVNVEVDVGPSHWSVGNVNLLGIILGVASERLVVDGSVREGRGLLAGQRRRRHLERWSNKWWDCLRESRPRRGTSRTLHPMRKTTMRVVFRKRNGRWKLGYR